MCYNQGSAQWRLCFQALTSTCEWFPWALTPLLELGSPLRGRASYLRKIPLRLGVASKALASLRH